MAISSTCEWECRTTGTDNAGGGFVPGSSGTDYSQQDFPQLVLTDVTIADGTTTNIGSVTGGFTAAMVGNIVNLTGGTGGTLTAQRRQVTAFVNANTLTLDQAPAPTAAMTGVTVTVGGALSGPWRVSTYNVAGQSDIVSGNVIWVQSGLYTRTSLWDFKNVAFDTTLQRATFLIGYKAGGARSIGVQLGEADMPEIRMTANSTSLFRGNGSDRVVLYNFKLTSTATTRADGVINTTTASFIRWVNCVFDGFSRALAGSSSSSAQVNARLDNCEVRNCTSHGVASGTSTGTWIVRGCYIHDNGGAGVRLEGGTGHQIMDCLIVNNADGVLFTIGTYFGDAVIYGCVIANNAGWQIGNNSSGALTGGSTSMVRSNILWGGTYCVGWSRATTCTRPWTVWENNAMGGASTSDRSNWDIVPDDIAITADPFVAPATRDYRLNNSPAAQLLKRVGVPKSMAGIPTLRSLGMYVPNTQTSCAFIG
jgi:hypothetical protein